MPKLSNSRALRNQDEQGSLRIEHYETSTCLVHTDSDYLDIIY